MTKSERKGLVTIYNTHNLHQFIWYYCTYGKDVEWYSLCLPGMDIEYLKELSEKTGIFKKVFSYSIKPDSLTLKEKVKLFFSMFISFIIGRKEYFCKKYISGLVDNIDYDTVVVMNDCNLISGILLSTGKKKEKIIFEDGIGDYLDRKYSNIFKLSHNFFTLQGFLLSVFGYANTGHYFPLRTTKSCQKFSTHPDKMKYRKYKSIKKLFDLSATREDEFKLILNKIYPEIQEYFKIKRELIIFTTPLKSYVKNPMKYVSLIEKHINSKYKRILLKKHPRDDVEYKFDESVNVIEVDQKIPAELILPFLKDIDIIFCDFSSIVLFIGAYNYQPQFFYFNELKAENLSENNVPAYYKTREEFKNSLNFYNFDENIIDI